MAFAAFDLLGGVITDRAAMTGGLDALAVQNGGSRTGAFAVTATHEDAERFVDDRLLLAGNPLAKDVIDGLAFGKIGGQIAPRTAALGQMEDGIHDAAAFFGRTTTLGSFVGQRLGISPLGVGEIGVIIGDFHRLNCPAAKVSPENPQSNQRFYETIFHYRA